MIDPMSNDPTLKEKNTQTNTGPTESPIKLPVQKKRSTPQIVGIIGLMVGSLIIFLLGVIVFQPYVYLSLLKRQGEPDKQIARTRTVI